MKITKSCPTCTGPGFKASAGSTSCGPNTLNWKLTLSFQKKLALTGTDKEEAFGTQTDENNRKCSKVANHKLRGWELKNSGLGSDAQIPRGRAALCKSTVPWPPRLKSGLTGDVVSNRARAGGQPCRT